MPRDVNGYHAIENFRSYYHIDDAIMTECHICGSPLEWAITVKWDDYNSRPVLHGTAFSCGIKFEITYSIVDDEYITTLNCV